MNGKYPLFHTRHIPQEHLRLDTPMGQAVKANGLCDVLLPDNLKRLRDIGVDVIETRLVWWECEPRPGVFDFSRFERDIESIEAAGLKPGVFPWLQHPPVWYLQQKASAKPLRCLEHDEDSSILSIWDPQTLVEYRRLMDAISDRFQERLKFIYLGISGDFGEYCFPGGIEHYKFSPRHGHIGFWAGDECARKDFVQFLKDRYGSAQTLSKAWDCQIADFDDCMQSVLDWQKAGISFRRDFAEWYTGSLDRFSDTVCSMYKIAFPETPAALPVGFPNEDLRVGMIKSHAARLAGKHGVYCRWTGIGHMGDFVSSNVLSRRLSSASQFYGARFATEAALVITEENAAACLYESMANGSGLIHDDPQNIFRAESVYRNILPKLIVDEPQTDIAVFWPVETEQLLGGEAAEEMLTQVNSSAMALRSLCDYHICDSTMIRDGFLSNCSDIVILHGSGIDKDVRDALIEFSRQRGRVWFEKESPKDFRVSTEDGIIAQRKSLKNGMYCFEIPRDAHADCFQTVHSSHVTKLNLVTNSISVKRIPETAL